MEYFIGSVITLIVISLTGFLARKVVVSEPKIQIKNSQSYYFTLLNRFLVAEQIARVGKPSQMRKHIDKLYTKILMVKGYAYWIRDNKLFKAEIVDNEVNEDNATEVDIMSMNEVELKEILLIVDKLKEDSYNDNWNAG
jgi:hypothetical protein